MSSFLSELTNQYDFHLRFPLFSLYQEFSNIMQQKNCKSWSSMIIWCGISMMYILLCHKSGVDLELIDWIAKRIYVSHIFPVLLLKPFPPGGVRIMSNDRIPSKKIKLSSMLSWFCHEGRVSGLLFFPFCPQKGWTVIMFQDFSCNL